MSLSTYAWLVLAFPLGSGGLAGTAGDWLAFARMLLAGGTAADGRRLLRADSVQLITSDHTTPAQREIGALFLTKFLTAFEIASLLLLVAAVGAVILARRRTGAAGAAEISVGQLMRGDVGTLGRARAETQIEAGGPAQR